jgi:plastocyanin
MKRFLNYFLIFSFSFISFTCKKEEKGSPGPNEIWFEYKAYNPPQRSIAVGTTITFTNKDNADHTATETSHLFDSGKVKSGGTYSYTFNTPGTYYFYCNYHSSNSSEQGAIRVQ